MTFRTLFLRNFALAALLPLILLAVFLVQDQEKAGRTALDRELLFEATIARSLFADAPPEVIQARLSRMNPTQGVRMTVIAADGRVLADTEASPSGMENHLDRPEVRQALHEGIGRAERHSDTLRENMRYLAIAEVDHPRARIYRTAIPLTMLQAQIHRTQWTILVAATVVLCFALFAANGLTRQIVAPIEALSEAAAGFAAGLPRARVIPDGPDVLRRLGSTFNAMVGRIETQVRSLDETQGYLDAVIRQMPEGLLVLDAGGAITRANAAAERLLGLPNPRILGRPILGVLLNYTLDTEVRGVLQGGPAASVEVRGPDGKSLRVAIGPLAVQSELAGAVVLLQDVSELRRADEMRRDFVANVSHELRTPIAAIRALVETLILRGRKRPELVDEYGPRVVSECERIDQLVNDLLLLAQTEAGQIPLDLESLPPIEAAEEAIRLVRTAAGTETTLLLEEFEEGTLLADRAALSQCLRNLIDNAVRYAAGGVVRVGCRRQGDQLVLYVADNGPGIPPDEVPRIFERFYRVDKARSREVGGSGLGLSIVRHLTEAQGGRVWAESKLGAGSTFYLAFSISKK
jgi:two-component system phosphate regulon sensor histidine kinase PhoR